MNKISDFEEIISASTLLDEEMEALRGGACTDRIDCSVGTYKGASCDIGKVTLESADKLDAAV